jgi:PIN domain nuclease of toxin-antitoxin system
VRLLLDTHAFLWSLTADRRLSREALAALAEGQNDVYVSAASAWEIAIKSALGRIALPDEIQRYIPAVLAQYAYQALPVTVDHAVRVARLPGRRGDPFDRLLVAQALTEDLTIVSRDKQLTRLGAKVLW